MLPSLVVPSLALVAGGTVLGLTALVARRFGYWAIAVIYIIGVATFLWLGPDLWQRFSFALMMPGEPLSPTGRAISTGLYGMIAPIYVLTALCAASAVLRAKAK